MTLTARKATFAQATPQMKNSLRPTMQTDNIVVQQRTHLTMVMEPPEYQVPQTSNHLTAITQNQNTI